MLTYYKGLRNPLPKIKKSVFLNMFKIKSNNAHTHTQCTSIINSSIICRYITHIIDIIIFFE